MNLGSVAGSKAARALVAGAGALATVIALVPTPAFPHAADVYPGPPTTFAAVVKRIRAEVRSLEEARLAGDLPDVTLHARRLSELTPYVPGLALTIADAARDSVVGQVLQAGVRLGLAAQGLQGAVEARDTILIAAGVERLPGLLDVLDAYAPKQYVCPMHCETGKTYDRPGSCPVCGMHLKLVTSDRYDVRVTPASLPIRARAPARLAFQIKDPAGFPVPASDLQVVHEKRLHLLIVSYDLSTFDHVHPTPEEDGRFTLRHRFPAGGRYVLYHDFTPDSVGMQVVPVELAVEGPERPRAPVVLDDGLSKRVDGYDVTLTHGPLAPGRECTITFTLARGGKPVTDLEPFLGAMGHLILISEDRASFVHSHPLDQSATGPGVEFKTSFQRTGVYKAWGQFQRRGRVITVPFVVQVSDDGGASAVER